MTVLGNTDIDGVMEGRLFKLISAFGGKNNLTTKLHCVATPQGGTEGDMLTVESEYAGSTFSVTSKYGSAYGGSLFDFSYAQAITPNFVVAGSGMWVGAQKQTSNQFYMRYAPLTSDWSTSLTWVGLQNLAFLHYKKIVTPSRVTLGAELMFSPTTLDSQCTLGAEFNLTQSTVKTAVDGGGKVQTTVSTQLARGGGANMLFSAEVDWMKDSFKFGYGLQIGG